MILLIHFQFHIYFSVTVWYHLGLIEVWRTGWCVVIIRWRLEVVLFERILVSCEKDLGCSDWGVECAFVVD